MPDIRQAVRAVTEHLVSLSALVPAENARLEEFQYDPEQGQWNLTFSFDDPYGPQRIYRKFEVDSVGQVISMKIREPAAPF